MGKVGRATHTVLFRIPENEPTPGVPSYSICGIILHGRKQDRRYFVFPDLSNIPRWWKLIAYVCFDLDCQSDLDIRGISLSILIEAGIQQMRQLSIHRNRHGHVMCHNTGCVGLVTFVDCWGPLQN